MKTLTEYANEYAKLVGGRLVATCPNFALVDVGGRTLELPGPMVIGWREACERMIHEAK